MNEDPDTTAVDPEAQLAAALNLEGFEEALKMDIPPMPEAGNPEPAPAADEREVEEKPEAESKETTESDDETEEPEAKPEISFDGFDDDLKGTLEKLYEEGHIDPERAKKLSGSGLRQADYTRKTMDLANKRKTFEGEMEERKADLELLDKIRGDQRLHDAWLRMVSGDVTEADGSDEDLVDRKTAREEARRELERRENEQKRVQAKRDAHIGAIREMVLSTIEQLGITKEQVATYLSAEEAMVPEGKDPIFHFTPEDLQRRIILAHEAAEAKAEAAALKERLERRSKKDARTTKQSLPPPRSAPIREGPMTPKQLVEAEFGLDPNDWSSLIKPGKMTAP